MTPGDFVGLGVRERAEGEAFGAFDPLGLVRGQVAGEHAAQAALLRLSPGPVLDGGAHRSPGVATATTALSPEDVRSEVFFAMLGDAHRAVRSWEMEAAADARFSPADMVRIWEALIAERRARNKPTSDAFGRELALHTLPDPLLELVDPRLLVADASHLPEDVEPWIPYVRGRQP